VPISISAKFHAVLFGIAAILISGNTNAIDRANEAESITVFAAASLADVMSDLVLAWQAEGGNPGIRISLGASGVIARQIEAGANADLFISANQNWIKYLKDRGHSASTAKVVAKNRLVLVQPCNAPAPKEAKNMSIPSGLGLLLASGRFAMADPRVSPAGAYTKSALEQLDLWDKVKENAAYAGSVRLALLLSERGGLPGFVYSTDASKSTLACTAIEMPAGSYPAIEYVGMLPKKNHSDTIMTAKRFLNWLTSDAAATIWHKHGFTIPVPK